MTAATMTYQQTDTMQAHHMPPDCDAPVLCEHCGAIIEDTESGEVVEIDGEYYCDDSCAHGAGYEQCENCGDWFIASEGEHIDGESFCNSSCANDAGYEQCAYCGEWFNPSNYGIEFEYDGDWFAFCDESCARSEGFEECERCGEWTRETDAYTVHDHYGDAYDYCESCASEYSYRCADCGELFTEDAIVTRDYEYYCLECARNTHSEYLHQYGYTPTLNYHGDASNAPYLGVELETDTSDYRANRAEYVDTLADLNEFNRHYWMTEDGSLNNGVEITSHPATLDYHVANIDLFDDITRTAINHGYTSHNNNRCGLHIHMSRSFFGNNYMVQNVCGLKLMRLMQRFERQFVIFSRRTNTSWCNYKTSGDYSPSPDVVSVKDTSADTYDKKNESVFTKANNMNRETNHSQAVNFQHCATFEVRIFRGTLKRETYFAALALVDGMARVVKNHGSIWCESVGWYDFIGEVCASVENKFARRCLIDYVQSKNLL